VKYVEPLKIVYPILLFAGLINAFNPRVLRVSFRRKHFPLLTAKALEMAHGWIILGVWMGICLCLSYIWFGNHTLFVLALITISVSSFVILLFLSLARLEMLISLMRRINLFRLKTKIKILLRRLSWSKEI